MSKLFIETIRIQNRRVCNIKYHQKRFDDTRSAFFPFAKKINIRNAIDTSLCKTNMTKCRITYNDNIVSVEYQEYSMRPIASLHCVNIDKYDYSYKYLDRPTLTNLFHQKPENIDDILIIKNEKVTDTHYANVAFGDQNNWFTPKEPLLNGTMRSYLLDKGMIKEKHILQSDIVTFKYITLFNAMIPFGKIKFKTSNII